MATTCSYGSVTSTQAREERNTDILIHGELEHKTVTCVYLVLCILALPLLPLLVWISISMLLSLRQWKLYLTTDGIQYTSSFLGWRETWFIPLQEVQNIAIVGSTSIRVYVNRDQIAEIATCPCYRYGDYLVLRNVKNAPRFVAAVKKQNENIDRSYHMETICNF